MEDAHTVNITVDGDPSHNFFGGFNKLLIT